MIIFAYVRKDNIGANVMPCPREAVPKEKMAFLGREDPRATQGNRRSPDLKIPKLLQFYEEVFSTVEESLDLLDVRVGRLFTAQRHLQRKIMEAEIQLVLCPLSGMP